MVEDISSSAMFSPERYQAAREGAVFLDRSDRGRIRLAGSDRLAYLQGLLTNDVAALGAGSGAYAALLTPQGRMISDMRVFELGDAVLLDVPAEVVQRVETHLADFVFSEDVTVQDVSDSLSHVVLLGPSAARVAGVRTLRPFENARSTVGGVEVTAAGNDEFGVPAVDLFVGAGDRPALLEALAAGGVTTIDSGTAEILRLEAGIPRFGADMDHETIPLEAGIEDRAISLTKGCYVGQEIIIRVLHRGQGRVARKLVGLTFAADGQVPAPGTPLRSGPQQVGSVTSAAWSPALGRPIALGYVKRDFTSPDTVLEAGEDQRQAATVTPLPFAVSAARP